jgi:hypothetical protein
MSRKNEPRYEYDREQTRSRCHRNWQCNPEATGGSADGAQQVSDAGLAARSVAFAHTAAEGAQDEALHA